MHTIIEKAAAGYRDGQPVNDKAYKVIDRTETYYDGRTPDDLIQVLEDARISRSRVRIWYGDRVSGREWGEENDVVGTIGRSTGPIKIPILLHNSRSRGGGPVLCDCIVKLMVGRRVAWQHPTYTAPAYRTTEPDNQPAGLPVRVDRAWSDRYGTLGPWEEVASFRSWAQASRWLDFMTGKRLSK